MFTESAPHHITPAANTDMSAENVCVVGIGELVWDQLPLSALPGGAPANFAFHARQLGANASIVSAVGNDLAGDDMRRWMSEVGLASTYIQRNDHSTGSVLVRLDDQGRPRYEIPDDSAWDHLEWNNEMSDLAQRMDCVCVGSLSQRSPRSHATIQRFMAQARPECIRIFDVNSRDPYCLAPIVHETLARANVLKVNDEEWLMITRLLGIDSELATGLPFLLKRLRLKLVVVTRGSLGSVLADRDGIHYLAASERLVADTVGAGDAFTAAVAMGLLRNRPLDEIHAHAAAVAGFVSTCLGAMPKLPAEITDYAMVRATISKVNGSALKTLPASVSTYVRADPVSVDRPSLSDATR